MTKAEMEYIWNHMGLVNSQAINCWTHHLWRDVQLLIKILKKRGRR